MTPTHHDDRASIFIEDCALVLESLPPESVQCCVTSPPYDSLRSYGSSFSWNFPRIATALHRVLIPGGVICWNVNDSTINGSESLTSFKQAILFVENTGFLLHDTMIYEKSNASKPTPNRYHQLFEYIFILSKGPPITFNPIIDKPNVTFGKSCFGKHTMREQDGSLSVRKDRKIAKEYGLRGNVWKGNTRGQEEVCQALPHPAMMPQWLARDLILSFSNPNDTIIDPFAGSGTTLAQALISGRKTIGIESNPSYLPLLLSSIQQRGLAFPAS